MSLAKLQVKVGGMACSFCTETIKKGLGRMEGVAEVNVSLAHEEVLIVYGPDRVSAAALTDTLRSLGYMVRDPKKVPGPSRTSQDRARPARRHEPGRRAGRAVPAGTVKSIMGAASALALTVEGVPG